LPQELPRAMNEIMSAYPTLDLSGLCDFVFRKINDGSILSAFHNRRFAFQCDNTITRRLVGMFRTRLLREGHELEFGCHFNFIEMSHGADATWFIRSKAGTI
jgi:hypothetical protein